MIHLVHDTEPQSAVSLFLAPAPVPSSSLPLSLSLSFFFSCQSLLARCLSLSHRITLVHHGPEHRPFPPRALLFTLTCCLHDRISHETDGINATAVLVKIATRRNRSRGEAESVHNRSKVKHCNRRYNDKRDAVNGIKIDNNNVDSRYFIAMVRIYPKFTLKFNSIATDETIIPPLLHEM